MKKLKWSAYVFILVGLFVISSCKKKGCTDPAANNYNKEAEKDDGTCKYDPVAPQEKGNHSYSLVSTNGDTLLAGEIPYVDGLAQVETDETGRYKMHFIIADGVSPGLLGSGNIFLGGNHQPETNSINLQNNEENTLAIQSLGMNGVMYATYEGTVTFENLQLRNQLSDDDATNRRATLTINYDGILIGMNEEQISANLRITFSN